MSNGKSSLTKKDINLTHIFVIPSIYSTAHEHDVLIECA